MTGKGMFFLIFAILPLCVFGHSPSEMTVEIDPENSLVNIEIFHSVSNGRQHYIRRVEMLPDNGPVIGRSFHFQPATSLAFSQKIDDLDSMEKLKITAYCKKGGMLTKEFDIKSMRETLEQEKK